MLGLPLTFAAPLALAALVALPSLPSQALTVTAAASACRASCGLSSAYSSLPDSAWWNLCTSHRVLLNYTQWGSGRCVRAREGSRTECATSHRGSDL